MLKHVSRFDYTAFAWLLPLEIHAIITDYCKTGIEPAYYKYATTRPVDSSITNIDFDNNGELMMSTKTTWHGLDFEKPIVAIKQDCANYYVVQMQNIVVVLRPDFSVHSRIEVVFYDMAFYDMALFHSCQKAVYIDKLNNLAEFDYINNHTNTYATINDPSRAALLYCMIACQRSGNMVTMVNNDALQLISSEYKHILSRFCGVNISWIGVDIWDQIIAAQYNRLNVFSPDLKTQLLAYDFHYSHSCWISCSGAINMHDGTLCFLDTNNHHIVEYKNLR